MGKFKFAALAATCSIVVSAAPAGAAVVIDPVTGGAKVFTNGYGAFQVITTGSAGATAAQMAGLNGSILFELIGGFNSNVLEFRYTLANISTGVNLGSSIGVFGFDVAPDAQLEVLTGVFKEADKLKNFNGLGKREFCLYEGQNCAGSGSAGVYVGEAPSVGTFTLTYGAPGPSEIIFTNVTTRWQRVAGDQEASASGTGPPMVVPEPATWAMMLLGFGAVGYSLRRRPRRRLVQAV